MFLCAALLACVAGVAIGQSLEVAPPDAASADSCKACQAACRATGDPAESATCQPATTTCKRSTAACPKDLWLDLLGRIGRPNQSARPSCIDIFEVSPNNNALYPIFFAAEVPVFQGVSGTNVRVLINDLGLTCQDDGDHAVTCRAACTSHGDNCHGNDQTVVVGENGHLRCHDAVAENDCPCGCPGESAEYVTACENDFDESACPAESKVSLPSESAQTILDVIDQLGGSVTESPLFNLDLIDPNASTDTAPRKQTRRRVRDALAGYLSRMDRRHRQERLASHDELAEPAPVETHPQLSPEMIGVLREAAMQLEDTADFLEHHDLFEQADQLRGQADGLRQEARETVRDLQRTSQSPFTSSPEAREVVEQEILRMQRELAELEAFVEPAPQRARLRR